ncbi:MAG: UPF0158 family protein [Myxococcota bacterium]
MPIDEPVLVAALIARDEGLLATFVDLQTGELVRLFDPAVTGRTNEATWTRIDQEPERYAEVPRYTRQFRLMQDFVDLVEDDDLARLLDTALTGHEAFRKFEVLLAAWPKEQSRWNGYRHDALVRWGVAWLRSLGVEPPWATELPQDSGLDVPELLRVALTAPGGPGTRTLELETPEQAARLFVKLAREVCELRREPFRARRVRGLHRFRRGGIDIVRRDRQVTLTLAPFPPATDPDSDGGPS